MARSTSGFEVLAGREERTITHNLTCIMTGSLLDPTPLARGLRGLRGLVRKKVEGAIRRTGHSARPPSHLPALSGDLRYPQVPWNEDPSAAALNTPRP